MALLTEQPFMIRRQHRSSSWTHSHSYRFKQPSNDFPFFNQININYKKKMWKRKDIKNCVKIQKAKEEKIQYNKLLRNFFITIVMQQSVNGEKRRSSYINDMQLLTIYHVNHNRSLEFTFCVRLRIIYLAEVEIFLLKV